MVLRIKTIREEFEAAKNGGYVYGYIQRQKTFSVYVELGSERDYTPSSKDDPNTEYRYFRDCQVYIAETDEQIDRGEYIFQTVNAIVIIYC